jgi:hypothetical protein
MQPRTIHIFRIPFPPRQLVIIDEIAHCQRAVFLSPQKACASGGFVMCIFDLLRRLRPWGRGRNVIAADTYDDQQQKKNSESPGKEFKHGDAPGAGVMGSKTEIRAENILHLTMKLSIALLPYMRVRS